MGCGRRQVRTPFRIGLKNAVLYKGTEGSNPASSTGESSARTRFFTNLWRSSHAAGVGAFTYSWRRSPYWG
jgi:hypothetical protein